MTRPVRYEAPSAGVSADSGTLRGLREKFLAESTAEYDADTVDAQEIADLLGKARRLR